MIFSMRYKIKLKYLQKYKPELADDYAYKKLKQIATHVIKKSKTKVIVKGMENIPKEPCVFIGNHQGIFDAFLLIYCLDLKIGFIAKQEIRKTPLVGAWMKESKSVFIDRGNPRQMVKSIDAGVENLKQGYPMVIFPEGTRSLSSTMGTFKKGSLKLATKIGAPIVPMTIDGSYRVLEVGKNVTGNTINLVFHPVVETKDLSKEEQLNLTEKVQKIVSDGLDNICKNK